MTFEDKVAAWLLTVQARELRRDSGHGYVTVRQVAQQFKLSRDAARTMLERMTAAEKVRKVEFANCLCWRSVNPLPWEPGGVWPPGCVLEPAPAPDDADAVLRDLAALKTNAPRPVQALIERARAIIQ